MREPEVAQHDNAAPSREGADGFHVVSASPSMLSVPAGRPVQAAALRAGVTTARALRRASEQISEGKAIGVALLDAKTNS